MIRETLNESAQKVQNYLIEKDFKNLIIEFEITTRNSLDAANAIGCELGQIAKSIIFKEVGIDNPVLIIVSGPNRVDYNVVSKNIGIYIEKADANFVRVNIPDQTEPLIPE